MTFELKPTASELITGLAEQIKNTGGDFELAVLYWTEMDVRGLFTLNTDDEVKSKLEDIQSALDSYDTVLAKTI